LFAPFGIRWRFPHAVVPVYVAVEEGLYMVNGEDKFVAVPMPTYGLSRKIEIISDPATLAECLKIPRRLAEIFSIENP
jgi:hypothetical protein